MSKVLTDLSSRLARPAHLLRLMSRRTRSFLPCDLILYKPQVQEAVPEQVQRKRQVAKRFYDRSAKPQLELIVRQPVRAQAHPQQPHSSWLPGTVKSMEAPQSYFVNVQGRTCLRNRIHLRDTLATGIPGQPPDL